MHEESNNVAHESCILALDMLSFNIKHVEMITGYQIGNNLRKSS